MRNSQALSGPLAFFLSLLLGVAQAQPNPPAKPTPGKTLEADPARDSFQLALLTYQEAVENEDPEGQKATFLAAIRQFSRFHTRFPKHADALKSWYYSAVCYQKIGDLKQFHRCLNQVVTKWKEGPLVGSAAFQLATDHYKSRRYEAAAALYALANSQSDDKATQQRSLYSRALCFERLKKQPETIAALRAVLADKGSPFQASARRVLAHYLKANKENWEEALTLFVELAKSKEPKTRADAILQCAQLARDLKKKPLAEKYFRAILTTPGLEEWRGEAQLSLMSEASLAKKHKDVIALYNLGDFALDKEPRARRLHLAAKAYEASGEKEKSTALYKKLAQITPNTMTALEAGYLVLSREYRTGSRDLRKQAEAFLHRFESVHPDDARIHNARLMVAENHFKSGKFGKATDYYDRIDLKHIDQSNHPSLRYRIASSLLQSGSEKPALKAFDEFIAKHPQHAQVGHALVKRAEIFISQEDSTRALAEFDRLLKNSKDRTLREYAWAQKAVLFKEAKKYAALAECHRQLLSDFPKRSAKKQAASNFWLGWAHFQLEEFKNSLKPFQNARTGDPALNKESSLHLVLAHYQLEQRDPLQREIDAIRQRYQGDQVTIPRPVYAWLGSKFATEKKYEDAWRYLQHAITPDEPSKTKAVVWRHAGRAALETGHHEQAVRPLEITLKVEESKYRKAETQYFLARAHLGLMDTERARKAAEACLQFNPQGILNGQTRILLGDVAMEGGNPNEAAKHFVVVVEFYSKDPLILRTALHRAIKALDLKGDAKSKQAAKRYRERLEKFQKEELSSPRG